MKQWRTRISAPANVPAWTRAQHPEFACGSFNSREMQFEFRRTDAAAELQRRQEEGKAEQEQQNQQEQQSLREVVPILEKAAAARAEGHTTPAAWRPGRTTPSPRSSA